MSKLLAADEHTLTAIREVIRREIARSQSEMPGRHRLGRGGIGHVVGVTDEAITARAGTTPGTGTVSIYERDIDAGTLSDTGEDIEAYNISQTAVASGAYVTCCQDNFGSWWVIVEDCG
jgi:hypothetical protein